MKHDWKDGEKVWRKDTGWVRRKESRMGERNMRRVC
jgi:hypothetical protein